MGYWNQVRQRINLLLGNNEGVEIVINGARLTPQQISAFKQLTGQPIPEPSHYWFDPMTGNLGFVGSPAPFYNLYAGASLLAGRGSQAPSLSERRQLFKQADLTGLWVSGD
jgi:hypothetical protein